MIKEKRNDLTGNCEVVSTVGASFDEGDVSVDVDLANISVQVISC